MDSNFEAAALGQRIKGWGKKLGFDAVGISGIDLGTAEHDLQAWLDALGRDHCWCMDLPPVIPVRCDAQCLCRVCLTQLISASERPVVDSRTSSEPTRVDSDPDPR